MNTNPFALVSTSILMSIPILFLIKVHRTIKEEPSIKLDKSILLILNVYNSREKTFPRDSLFLALYL